MSVDAKVSIFSTKMRVEFLKSYNAVAQPAPWQEVTQVVDSTARIEHYTWMSPTPAMSLYKGHRNYGKVGAVRYSVENKEFADGFEVSLRDVEDDQTSGYELKPAELSAKAKLFPGRWVFQHLALGDSLTCFDGTNFFASSHTIGTGNNLSTSTGSGNSDGLSYKLVALYTGGPLKPMLWQSRKGPAFMTNAGTPAASESKTARYWIDLEGQAAYGWWWNSVQHTFTNLPTISEVQTAFGTIEAKFRTFYLPLGLAADTPEYLHEQTQFNAENLFFVGSTQLNVLLRQALNQEWVPQNVGSNTVATTNLYNGYARYAVSRFFDPGVTVNTDGHS